MWGRRQAAEPIKGGTEIGCKVDMNFRLSTCGSNSRGVERPSAGSSDARVEGAGEENEEEGSRLPSASAESDPLDLG